MPIFNIFIPDLFNTKAMIFEEIFIVIIKKYRSIKLISIPAECWFELLDEANPQTALKEHWIGQKAS